HGDRYRVNVEPQPACELRGNFLERLRQVIDVLVGVEGSGADADRSFRKCSQRPMDIGGAMQAGPDGDSECLVEDAPDFRRRQHLTAQTQRTDALGMVLVAEDFIAANLLQATAE